MSYKLVCIDIDGTLLNSKKRLSKVTRDTLKKAYDKGVNIVVTTGRNFNNASYYSDLIGVKSAVIAANGAFIKEKDSDQTIFKHEIPIDLCKKILKIAEENKVCAHFHTIDSIFNNSFLHSLVARMVMTFGKPKSRKVNIVNVTSKDQWNKIFNNYKEQIVKCIIIDFNKNKLKKVRSILEQIEGLEILSSGGYNIEINKKDTSKGNAIKYLAQYYGIKREEIIAIGDNENDLSMIKYAGLGIAMGNGIKIVKDNADYITDTNDNNGVAKAIEKFVLK